MICTEFVFSCTVLFVSISHVIGCEDRLRNDHIYIMSGGALNSTQTKPNLYVKRYVVSSPLNYIAFVHRRRRQTVFTVDITTQRSWPIKVRHYMR